MSNVRIRKIDDNTMPKGGQVGYSLGRQVASPVLMRPDDGDGYSGSALRLKLMNRRWVDAVEQARWRGECRVWFGVGWDDRGYSSASAVVRGAGNNHVS